MCVISIWTIERMKGGECERDSNISIEWNERQKKKRPNGESSHRNDYKKSTKPVYRFFLLLSHSQNILFISLRIWIFFSRYFTMCAKKNKNKNKKFIGFIILVFFGFRSEIFPILFIPFQAKKKWCWFIDTRKKNNNKNERSTILHFLLRNLDFLNYNTTYS